MPGQASAPVPTRHARVRAPHRIMSTTRKSWWHVGVGVALGLGIAAAFYLTRKPPSPSAYYVDAATCAGCHAAQAVTYRRTGMGRSFHHPTSDDVKPATYYHKPSDSYFTMEE